MNEFEYTKPIIHDRRTGNADNPFLSISETHVVNNDGTVVLSELPDEFSRVSVSGDSRTWIEISKGTPEINQYKVDYTNRFVTFNIAHIGKQLTFDYKGTGLTYVDPSSVWTQQSNGKITETLRQLTDSTEQAKQDVIDTDNLVQANEDVRESNEATRISQEETRELEHDIAIQDVDNLVADTSYIEPYNSTTTYQKNNIVYYNGASYMAKQTTVGNTPTDSPTDLNWGILSRKGTDGTGTVHVHRDKFVATEGQTIFTLSHNYDQFQNRTNVWVGHVPQKTPENYEESGQNTIAFYEGLSDGTVVEVEYFSESVPLETDIQTTVDNHTTEINKFNNQSIYIEEFTATEGQTIFTLQTTYDQLQDRVEVYVDGVLQDSGDNFTESANNEVTLSEGVPAGTEVIVKYIGKRMPIVTDVEATLNTHSSEIQDINGELAQNTSKLYWTTAKNKGAKGNANFYDSIDSTWYEDSAFTITAEDSTLFIQSALDEVETQHVGKSQGGKVVLDGSFRITSPLKIGDNVTLELSNNSKIIRDFSEAGTSKATIVNKDMVNGNSNISIIGGDILASDGMVGKQISFKNVDGFRILNTNLSNTVSDFNILIADGCKKGLMDNLHIESGTGQWEDGIHFLGTVSDVLLSNSYISSGDDALAFTIEETAESSTNGDLQNINVVNCILISEYAAMIKIHTNNTTSYSIRHLNISNIVGNSNQCPIEIMNDSVGGMIEDISINDVIVDASRSTRQGLWATGVDNLFINKLRISDSFSYGVEMSGCKTVKMDSCVIDSPKSNNCYQFYNCEDIRLINCDAINPVRHGFNFGETDYPVTTGSVINCKTKDVDATYNGINLFNVTGLKVAFNDVQSSGNGIVEGSGSTNNIIAFNDVRNVVGSKIYSPQANTTKVSENFGFTTKDSGEATLPSANAGVNISTDISNLSIKDIQITPTNDLGNVTKYWITIVDSTTFRINTDVVPSTKDGKFSWLVDKIK